MHFENRTEALVCLWGQIERARSSLLQESQMGLKKIHTYFMSFFMILWFLFCAFKYIQGWEAEISPKVALASKGVHSVIIHLMTKIFGIK